MTIGYRRVTGGGWLAAFRREGVIGPRKGFRNLNGLESRSTKGARWDNGRTTEGSGGETGSGKGLGLFEVLTGEMKIRNYSNETIKSYHSHLRSLKGRVCRYTHCVTVLRRICWKRE